MKSVSKLLEYAILFTQKHNGHPPTMREAASELKYPDLSSVNNVLSELEKLGKTKRSTKYPQLIIPVECDDILKPDINTYAN